MSYNNDDTYLIPGHVLNRVLAIASRMNSDSPWKPFEQRDLAQEIQAKLADAEGPVDLDRICDCRFEDDDDLGEDDELDELDVFENDCTLCGGDTTFIGTLGNLDHFRCRDCGAQVYHEHPEKTS